MNSFIPRTHQVESADKLRALLVRRKAAADCSETGTGKTISSLLAIERTEFEFLVVCPLNVKSHWNQWIAELGMSDRCLGVLNWEECKLGVRPRIYSKQNGFFMGLSKPRVIIFDEAHRAKSHKTLNAKMVQCARRQGHYLLLLSATLLQSPLNLGGLAYPLGLIPQQTGWFNWARQFGVGIGPWGGYEDLSTKEHRLRLHNLVASLATRVKRSDIPDFVEGVYQADLIDAGEARDLIASEYDKLQAEIAELRSKEANAAEVLTARLRGRQAIELLKAPIFLEIAQEHLDEGAKVALFCNFRATIQWIEDHAPKVPVRIITGSSTEKQRSEALAVFQGHPGPALILCMIQCASEGISLHDVDGYERISLISPGESATHLIQALGRNVRLGSKSIGVNRILFVANTIEQTVYSNTRRKIRAIANIADGDLDLFPQLATTHANT